MEPYEYMDPDDRKLTIWQRNPAAGTDALIRIYDGDEATITVKQSAVREITGKLYEACGLPVPVILERPAPREMLAAGPHGDEVVHVEPSPAGHPSNRPGVVLELGSQSVRLIGDEPLRVALALVDAMREAEAEPDPAEVEELAALMHAEACTPACAMRLDGHHHTAARAALRWMNAKAARDDA